MSVANQLEQGAAKGSRSIWKQWVLPALAAVVLTPLAMLAHKYKFVNDDQILYIPILRHRLDPTLYPGDYFFNQPQANVSLFEDLLSWPVRLFGLEWSMLLGYLLAQFLILFCVFILARRLTGWGATGYLAMVLVVLPVSIGGTYVRTYDDYFNPRTFTLPISLLVLLALWWRRPWPAAILATLHLLLHPLSGLHSWMVTLLLLVWWAWKKMLPRSRWLGPLVLLLAGLGYLAWSSGGSGGWLWLDPAWREVLWKRTSYVFLESWRADNWLSLVLYAALGIVAWGARPRDQRSTQLGLAVLVVAVTSTLLVAVGVDGLGLAPLTQLQLARSWRLVILLAVMFGADLALTLNRRPDWGAWLAGALLGVTIYFDRGKADWQPTLAVLLAAVVAARLLERGRGARGRRLGSLLLAVTGIVLIVPSLLAAWPVTESWASRVFDNDWRIPEEGVWPVLLVFGVLMVLHSLTRKADSTLSSSPRPNWAGLLIGSGLLVLGLLPLAKNWGEQAGPGYLDARLQLPGRAGWMSEEFAAWRDLQLWAADYTALDARFATDPDLKGFRVFSARVPIVEEKDGAPSMFSRDYGLEWDRRMQAMAETGVVDPDKGSELQMFSLPGLQVLHGQYPFDYVVGQGEQDLPWAPVYQNQIFAVYSWQEQ